MTSENNNLKEGKDGKNEKISTNILRAVTTFLEDLKEIEEKKENNKIRSNRVNWGSTKIDYKYNVRVGLKKKAENKKIRKEKCKGKDGKNIEFHIEDDKIIITADLPGKKRENINIKLQNEKNKIILSLKNEKDIIRNLPPKNTGYEISDTKYKNNILTIFLKPKNKNE